MYSSPKESKSLALDSRLVKAGTRAPSTRPRDIEPLDDPLGRNKWDESKLCFEDSILREIEGGNSIENEE